MLIPRPYAHNLSQMAGDCKRRTVLLGLCERRDGWGMSIQISRTEDGSVGRGDASARGSGGDDAAAWPPDWRPLAGRRNMKQEVVGHAAYFTSLRSPADVLTGQASWSPPRRPALRPSSPCPRY